MPPARISARQQRCIPRARGELSDAVMTTRGEPTFVGRLRRAVDFDVKITQVILVGDGADPGDTARSMEQRD